MYVNILMESLKNHYDNNKREGVHVSDLTYCARKSALRILEPVPTTEKELGFFTSGEAIGTAIQVLAKMQEGRFEIEKEVTFQNIVAHVDLWDSHNNIPIECKSTRVKEVKEPKPFNVYQLKAYMSMLNADKGVLLYQCLMNFDGKPFCEFEITMTQEERNQFLQEMVLKATLYQENLEAKTPMNIDGVLKDKTLDWLCKDCPYLTKCCKDQEELKEKKSK